MGKHIKQFESLRGLAAVWVFISHAVLIAELPRSILNNGSWGVDLFVVLSGFVITLLIIKRPEPYGGYLFRRFMRLYPLYLIALALGLATYHLYGPVIGESWFGTPARDNFFQRGAVIAANLPTHLALHLTMLHGAVPDALVPLAALAISGPLWSISLEWQFYLIAPLLIWALDVRQPNRRLIALATFFGTLVAAWVARKVWDADVPSFLPLRLPLFAAGILCGVLWERARSASSAAIVTALAVGVAILALRDFAFAPLALWSLIYWAAAVAGRSKAAAPLNNVVLLAPLSWLGERSYGIYVLHMPIMLAIANWLIAPNAVRWGQPFTILALLCCFPVVVALAAVLYRFVEQPVIKWAKNVSIGRGASVPVPATGPASAA